MLNIGSDLYGPDKGLCNKDLKERGQSEHYIYGSHKTFRFQFIYSLKSCLYSVLRSYKTMMLFYDELPIA